MEALMLARADPHAQPTVPWGIRRKLREWFGRYLPAELLGTITALAAAWTVHAVSGSLISAAVAGTIGESLGFYGCMAVREAFRNDTRHRHHGPCRWNRSPAWRPRGGT